MDNQHDYLHLLIRLNPGRGVYHIRQLIRTQLCILLDHILILPKFMIQGAIKVLKNTARIEHAKYLTQNDADWTSNTKPDRMLYPSDHRPISVSIEY